MVLVEYKKWTYLGQTEAAQRTTGGEAGLGRAGRNADESVFPGNNRLPYFPKHRRQQLWLSTKNKLTDESKRIQKPESETDRSR